MSDTKICRHCGKEIKSDATKCKFCKQNLVISDTPDMFCKRCKSPVNEADNFCQKCGAIFNIPEIVEQPVVHNANGIPYHIGIFFTSFAVSLAITVSATIGKEVSIGGIFVYYAIGFIISEIFLYIYFLPSIIAIENNKTNLLLLYIGNLLLGITVVGWFIVLILALKADPDE